MERNYEIMFIARPNLEDEARKELVDYLTTVLTEQKAEITKVEDLGLRNLAYEIEDFRKGYYYVINTKAPVGAIQEFDRLVRINENIIRYIIVKEE